MECTRCGERLNPDRAVWLELDMRTAEYQLEGAPPLPEEHSQGGFPFGPDCAKRPNAPVQRRTR